MQIRKKQKRFKAYSVWIRVWVLVLILEPSVGSGARTMFMVTVGSGSKPQNTDPSPGPTSVRLEPIPFAFPKKGAHKSYYKISLQSVQGLIYMWSSPYLIDAELLYRNIILQNCKFKKSSFIEKYCEKKQSLKIQLKTILSKTIYVPCHLILEYLDSVGPHFLCVQRWEVNFIYIYILYFFVESRLYNWSNLYKSKFHFFILSSNPCLTNILKWVLQILGKNIALKFSLKILWFWNYFS